MKLLSVLLVFAICIGMSWSFDGTTRQLLAIDGPLYIDSASLRPAVLTRVYNNFGSLLFGLISIYLFNLQPFYQKEELISIK